MSSPTEERLARALAPHARTAEPTAETWAGITARGGELRRRSGRRRMAAALTAAALVIAALAVVGLERARDTDGPVTIGEQPHAAVDPELIDLARKAILLADAAAREGRFSMVEPRSEPDLVAARAATDAAAAAWAAVADRYSDDPEIASARGNVRVRLANLPGNRTTINGRMVSPAHIAQEIFGHLIDEAVDHAHEAADVARSGAAARQVSDAAAIAAVGTAAVPDTMAATAPVSTVPSTGLVMPLAPSARLADEVSPAHRDAVIAILADRRYDDTLAATGPGPVPNPVLLGLAAERQERLVTLALTTLDEPPPVTADDGLLHAVARDLVALRAARDGELWATLVGEPGDLGPARTRADDALVDARRSLDRLHDEAGFRLDGTTPAERAASKVPAIRQQLDSQTLTEVDAARQLAESSATEGRVLMAATDAGSIEARNRLLKVTALSTYASHQTHAAALAVRGLPDAPPEHAGGFELTELRALRDVIAGDQESFNESGSANDRVSFRATADDAVTSDLITRIIDVDPRYQYPTWERGRGDARQGLDTLHNFVAGLVG
jgi:hypothetical protein